MVETTSPIMSKNYSKEARIEIEKAELLSRGTSRIGYPPMDADAVFSTALLRC